MGVAVDGQALVCPSGGTVPAAMSPAEIANVEPLTAAELAEYLGEALGDTLDDPAIPRWTLTEAADGWTLTEGGAS